MSKHKHSFAVDAACGDCGLMLSELVLQQEQEIARLGEEKHMPEPKTLREQWYADHCGRDTVQETVQELYRRVEQERDALQRRLALAEASVEALRRIIAVYKTANHPFEVGQAIEKERRVLAALDAHDQEARGGQDA